jgi:enoyl-CoA hydratase
MTSTYETIVVEERGRVALITLNRPDALNALNAQMIAELTEAVTAIDANPAIAVSVMTGAGRAFAAGADIREMYGQDFASMFVGNYFADADRFANSRKPIVAAVNGFALGGGCELAMMCDIIIASNKARFGQPEIKLGVTPGMGGSVRLTKAIGKARAMDLVLTGRMIDANEAGQIGLISRVVEHEKLQETVLAVAEEIASFSIPSLLAAKEMVTRSLESSTSEAIKFERRLFNALFSTEDRREGMAAFTEKRVPSFVDR